MKISRIITLLCSTSGAALLLPAPVWAQAARAAAAPAAAAANNGIEEIVVTAQRRTERLEKVPMALTALSTEQLEKAHVVNLEDITSITPGVQINRGGAYIQPSIRGITALTNGTGNENNVAIYVDGYFVSDAQSIDTDLNNISNIQVLKGPQGALYGRQAAGGAILINTVDPTHELTGKFEGSYGRFHDKRIQGYFSGPLGKNLFFMVSGAFHNSDGYMKLASMTNPTQTVGPAAPKKQRSFRAKLLWEATDNLKITAGYNYALASDTIGGAQYTVKDHIPSTIAGPNGTRLPNPNFVNTQYGFYTLAYNHVPLQVTRASEAQLKIEWDNPIGTLTSRTGGHWQKNRTAFDFDGGFTDSTFSDGKTRQKTFQEAVDYNITAIKKLDLIVGGLYFYDNYHPYFGPGGGGLTFSPPPAGQVPNFSQTLSLAQIVYRHVGTKSFAFFADATYHVNDKLSINVGGRYNSDRKEISLHSPYSLVLVNGMNPYQDTNAHTTFHKFTPRVTIRYEVADRSNVYASFSQGYKSGSYNANGSPVSAIASVPIKAETITAYEIGYKTAQRIFHFETSAFYYDYKNLNISLTTINPLGPAFGAATIIGNVPKSKIYGFDFQAGVEPIDRLNINVGGTYLHARYGNFTNASGVDEAPDPFLPGNFININQPKQDWTHIQMARSPTFSANLAVDYSVDVGGGELRISGNARYTTRFVPSNPAVYGVTAAPDKQREERFTQKENVQLGGEIRWTDPTDHYWAAVYGTNLTNVKTKLAYTGTATGSYFVAAPPIQYGAKIGYKF
jgi:iron complex outermembrane receptor protein